MNTQDSIPVKRRTGLIYLVIILSFLLLAWIVWLIFEWRIKEVGKKKDQFSVIVNENHPLSICKPIDLSVPPVSPIL